MSIATGLFPDVPPERRRSTRASPPDSGSDTSREAAERIAPIVSGLSPHVLRFVVLAGEHGATGPESQLGLGLSGDRERPRRWELQRRGLIRDPGMRRRSSTAVVWVGTDKATAGKVPAKEDQPASGQDSPAGDDRA